MASCFICAMHFSLGVHPSLFSLHRLSLLSSVPGKIIFLTFITFVFAKLHSSSLYILFPNPSLRLAHAGVLRKQLFENTLWTLSIAFILNVTWLFPRDPGLCKLLHFTPALAWTAGLTHWSQSWCLAWDGHLATSKCSCSLHSTCCYHSYKTLVTKLKIKSEENKIAIESKFYLGVFLFIQGQTVSQFVSADRN